MDIEDFITDFLKIPGVKPAVLAAIPDDWEYRETEGGDNPTTSDIAFWWLYEKFKPAN